MNMNYEVVIALQIFKSHLSDTDKHTHISESDDRNVTTNVSVSTHILEYIAYAIFHIIYVMMTYAT